MKLYKKKITSYDELMQEKQRLRDEIKRMEDEGFFSVEDILNSFRKAKGDNMGSTLVSGLKSDSVKDIALSVGLPLLKLAGFRIEAHAIKATAKELIGSYAKWKVMQLAYKGVLLALDKYKTKKGTG